MDPSKCLQLEQVLSVPRINRKSFLEDTLCQSRCDAIDMDPREKYIQNIPNCIR